MKNVLAPFAAFILFLFFWNSLIAFGIVPVYILPLPSQVFSILSHLDQELLTGFLNTALAAATGFFMSFVVGFLLALLLSLTPLLKSAALPFATFFQTVPIVAVAPLLVIWFGFGFPTVVMASFIVSFFPMLANCLTGFSLKNKELSEMLTIFNASGWQRFLYLQLPLAIPSILTGLRISAGLSVVGAIVGEFVAGGGLGGTIDAARTQQRVDLVFAAIFLSAFIGLIFVGFVDGLNKILLIWRPFYETQLKNK